MKEVLRLRPVPRDFVQQLLQQKMRAAQQTLGPEELFKRQQWAQKQIERDMRPSQRALDPDHAVGIVTRVLCTALPKSQE